jgi:hypothetical protein
MATSGEQSQWALEVGDRHGRIVRYSTSNYQRHVIKHPEIDGLIEDIRQTIADPDIEIDADNGHVYLYRSGMGGSRYSRLWLFVVVLYQNVGGAYEGIVKTSFFTSKLARNGRITWMRSDP